MLDIWTEAVAILIASLCIVAVAIGVIVFRPAARRRRRHRKHTHRPKIDLLRPEEPKPDTDA